MKLLFVLGAALLASPVSAQQSTPAAGTAVPAASESARRLVGMLGIERSLDSLFQSLTPLAANQAVSSLEANPSTSEYTAGVIQHLPGGRLRLVQIFSEEFLAEFRKRYPEFKSELAVLYQARFSQAELNDMVRFFSSGTGEKYLALQPELQAHMKTVGEGIGRRAGEAAAPNAMRRAETESGAAPLGGGPARSR